MKKSGASAYIFDLDGTLLDSMGIWTQIDVDFLSKRDINVPFDYVDVISSLSLSEAAKYTIDRFGLSETAEDLVNEWKSMAKHAYSHTVPMKPYAKEYLYTLKRLGAKLGIATSLPQELYKAALNNHGIFSLFDAVCSTDEVGCGKTKPDVFLLAASKLGVESKDCIVFEDILQAIISAKHAGMTVCGVYDESAQEQWSMIRQIADGVIYDFSDAPLPK